MEIIKRVCGKPKSAPRAARIFSAEYERARADLLSADRQEGYWHGMLTSPAGNVIGHGVCVAEILKARRKQIDALWRLGWDEVASELERDTAVREMRHATKYAADHADRGAR
jgi:hypothetical protein